MWLWTEPLAAMVEPNLCGGGYHCSYETTELQRSSCNESLAAQQNMHGLVGSTDLEMEVAETDEVMVRQKDE